MLKYITKLAMEIVPSVVATILGAYIVNHYINAKTEPPAAAVAAASTADVKATDSKADTPKLDGIKADAASAEVSNIPGPGIKAKGVSEKSVSEKPAEVKPTETASLPVETPRHSLWPKRTVPPAATEAPAAPATEERRDAADLARAAIERLRASEAARPDAARTAAVSPVRPLPPPVMVSTPTFDGTAAGAPSYTGSVQGNGRLTPPADIPAAQPARPLDLRADGESTKDRMNNVAEDMLSAAKSVFHSVLPK
jgi:hypothetical protein